MARIVVGLRCLEAGCSLAITTPLVELDDVSYRAGQKTILQQVNWTIEPGHHWAVLGPNGSGKTTLLRLATGYIWPTGGSVRRLGRELLDLGELRKSIGWISAELTAKIPPHELAFDTVVSGRFAQVGFKNLRWLQPTADDRRSAFAQLQQLSCEYLAERPFGVLSQGEKQKVLIARARMAGPLLLVLDEPCAGMDPGARERMLSTIDALAREPSAPTIIFVTHHVEEIVPPFANTLVMNSGQIAASGTTRAMITAEQLEEIYGVPVARVEHVGDRFWPIWG